MTITVQFSGQLVTAAGVASARVDAEDGGSVEGLLRAIVDAVGGDLARFVFDREGRVQSCLLVVVDGEQVGLGEPLDLSEGSDVMLLAPMAGG